MPDETSPAQDIRPTPVPRPRPTPAPRPTVGSAGIQKVIDRINASNLPPEAKAAVIALVKALYHA